MNASHDNPARPDDKRRTPRFLTVRQLADYLQVFYHPDRFQYQMDLTLDG